MKAWRIMSARSGPVFRTCRTASAEISSTSQSRPAIAPQLFNLSYEMGCFLFVAGTPGSEDVIAAAKGATAKRKDRNFEARSAELSIFHWL
jgi:hypothetical protein